MEQRVGLADSLGRAEEKEPAGVQRVVEDRNEPLLQIRAEVDHEVAATDEVELRERRILDDVLLGEDEQVADPLVDAVAAVLGGKKPGEPFGRDVGGDAGGIDAGARGGDRPAVDVGGEHLHRVTLLERLHPLDQKDGERIRLLAGRAAGRPDADRPASILARKKLRDDLFLEHLERLRVPEKVRYADEQVAE